MALAIDGVDERTPQPQVIEGRAGGIENQVGGGQKRHGEVFTGVLLANAVAVARDVAEGERVQLAPVADGRMAGEPGHWGAVGKVTGIDRPFILDVIVKDDLVDACIDNRRTIIARNRLRLDGDRLFLFADHGEVTFEEIQVRPLLEE